MGGKPHDEDHQEGLLQSTAFGRSQQHGVQDLLPARPPKEVQAWVSRLYEGGLSKRRRRRRRGKEGGREVGGGIYESAPPKGVWYLYSIPFKSAIASCSFLTVV